MLANVIHSLLIILITMVWGVQSVVWWNFFFRTNHPGPREIIIANHFSFFGALMLTVPGVALMWTNINSIGWYTFVYGVSAVLECLSTYYANRAIGVRRREVVSMEAEVAEMQRRVDIIRRRGELMRGTAYVASK